jgi:hypothetical protein
VKKDVGIVVHELSSGHHIRSFRRDKQEKSAFDTVTYESMKHAESGAPEAPPESLRRDRLNDTERGPGWRLRRHKPVC